MSLFNNTPHPTDTHTNTHSLTLGGGYRKEEEEVRRR